ncbi:hypothetical protein HRG_012927 [Hirsutella rhossiliensis]
MCSIRRVGPVGRLNSDYFLAHQQIPLSILAFHINSASAYLRARILVSVSSKSPCWPRAWAYPEEIIAVALSLVKEDNLISSDKYNDPSQCLFLAKERWDGRVFIVFDVFHDAYNPDSAHLPGQNDLPVTLVHLSRRNKVNVAPTPVMRKLNRELEELHNSTGLESRPPFSVDHANGQHPTYDRPRTCIILQSHTS